jgi:hypothetical protein
MNLIERAKKIITSPKDEWVVIDQENTSITDLIIKYLIPLALIPAIASFIGFWIFYKFGSFSFGIKYAVIYLITYIGGALLAAYIIDALAPSFASTKDFRKAFQLVVYSYTPMMVASIVLIFPSLGILVLIAGLYSLYLLFIGLKPMMKTPDDKTAVYFIVSLVVLIVVYFVISAVLTRIFIGNIYLPRGI